MYSKLVLATEIQSQIMDDSVCKRNWNERILRCVTPTRQQLRVARCIDGSSRGTRRVFCCKCMLNAAINFWYLRFLLRSIVVQSPTTSTIYTTLGVTAGYASRCCNVKGCMGRLVCRRNSRRRTYQYSLVGQSREYVRTVLFIYLMRRPADPSGEQV